jgi:hypothetical protein
MHPRLSEIVVYLEEQRRALLAAVDSVPAARRDVRPAADAWSVAEVLDHLHRVERGSTGLLAKRIARGRETGIPAEAETSSVLGSLDLQGLIDSPARSAPELVLPDPTARSAELLQALAASRAGLLALLADVDGLDLTRVTATHAAFGELNAYQWTLFLGAHERRHARQIAAIAGV